MDGLQDNSFFSNFDDFLNGNLTCNYDSYLSQELFGNIAEMTVSTDITSPFTANSEGIEEIEDEPRLLKQSKKIKKEKLDETRLVRSKNQLWSQVEDSLLISLIEQHGEKWAEIAKKMPGKNRRQIRNRYMSALKPGISREGWTEEEVKLLYFWHGRFGNKWCEIAKKMSGRTENQVKNKYYSDKRQDQLEFQRALLEIGSFLDQVQNSPN